MEAVYEIDSQGADTLQALATEMHSQGTQLLLARAHGSVREAMQRLGATAQFEHAMFATVEEAVAAPRDTSHHTDAG
jgi:anti-anti-sigma regulatory factor